MIKKLVRFTEERTGSTSLVTKALRYVFPDHWSFLLGEIALYAFIVLVATGIYLTLFFDASTAQPSTTGRTRRSRALMSRRPTSRRSTCRSP